MGSTLTLLAVGGLVLIEFGSMYRALMGTYTWPFALHWALLIVLTIMIFLATADVTALMYSSNVEMQAAFKQITEALHGLGTSF